MGDGSIDSTELKTFADDLGSKTGTKIDASSLMTALDSDGDGSVTSTELKDNGKALFEHLRQQLMGSQVQAPAAADKPAAGKPFSSTGSSDTGNDYISKLVASLIAQYGASQSDATSAGSTLSVAA